MSDVTCGNIMNVCSSDYVGDTVISFMDVSIDIVLVDYPQISSRVAFL